MANDLTAFTPEYWAPTMQETFFKESVALGIANTELRADLKDGDTLHKPYGGFAKVQTYVKGTDIVVKDINVTDDYLTVGTAKVASFYVDDIDRVQNKYDAIKEFASGAMKSLNNVLDQAVIKAGVDAAATTVSGASIGETAGGIALTISNIPSVFAAGSRVLNTYNRTGGDRFALIGPRILEALQLYVGGRETGFGETVNENGKISTRLGFGLRLSNNLYYTATLTTSVIPVAGNTISVNGVVFTARASGAATGAGGFSIGADAAAATVNLVAAINGTGTPGVTTYIALSEADRHLLDEAGIVATDNTTDIGIVGYGDIVVAETITSATDVWSAQYQYALMGQVGSIDLVTQVAPNVVFRDAQLRLGKYVHPWMLFGTKVFENMKKNLVSVKIDASAWV